MRWTNGITSFYQGDCREVLAELPAESVQCVVTSPPYWGLRDYGTGSWEGGDADCQHQGAALGNNRNFVDREGRGSNNPSLESGDCLKCGAKRLDKQLGLEPTPDAYVATMVEVFRAVRRVLRKDGTVWLNLGDSYVGTGHKGKYTDPRHREGRNGQVVAINNTVDGLKPKDLVGIPWRVAFALQADGWYLRSDIIWSKPNPMPESVTDRPTKAHEYIFLLTKSPKYYYDADAIRESNGNEADWNNYGGKGLIAHPTGLDRKKIDLGKGMSQPKVMPNATHPNGRNKRSVWEIATQPYPEAHFATFPEALVKPCILAGTKEQDTVLDPFAGSGTVMQVAQQLGRKSIGVELNDEYIDLAAKRLERIPFPMIGI